MDKSDCAIASSYHSWCINHCLGVGSCWSRRRNDGDTPRLPVSSCKVIPTLQIDNITQ
jgi:hypothetical protein